MNENEVAILIRANAAAVAPGVAEAKASIAGLSESVSTMGAGAKAMSDQMKAGFAGAAASANEFKGALGGVHAATEAESSALREMVARIHEGAESVRTFQMRAKEFAEVYVAMFAVEQVSEFINKMGEAAEKTEHLAQTFGMSVGQIQQLQGVATATGINIDALTKGMGIFDKNMVLSATSSGAMAQAFKAVGVSADDGRTQMEKLATVADKFKDMDNGPKKVALAMELFGKSGKDLIPVLNMGSEGITELNNKLTEYGVVNESAVEKGAALAESTNETKLGFLGINNVLTDALAPAFKSLVDGVNSIIAAFVESYKEGGIVADIFAFVSTVIQEVVAVVEALGEVFAAVWNVITEVVSDIASAIGDVFGVKVPGYVDYAKVALNEFKDVLTIVKDAVLIFVEIVGGEFRMVMQVIITFGKVAWDALSLNWGAIAGDWKAGMAKVESIVDETANKVKEKAAEMASAVQAAARGEAVDSGKKTGVDLPKAGGDFDFNPQGKAKKGKGDHASVVGEWKQELSDMLMEEKNWGADEAQLSLQFWEQKLAQTKKGSKEELEVRREITRQKLALFKEEQQDELAAIKQTETLKLDAVKTDIGLQKIALQEKLEAIDQEERAGRLSATRAIAARNQVNAQLYALDSKMEEQEYQLHLKALQDQLALEHLKPQERAAVNRQIEVLEKQHLDRMALLNAQTNAKILADDNKLQNAKLQNINKLATAWGQALGKMATMQQGFRATVQEMWQGLAGIFSDMISNMVREWIVGLVTRETAEKTVEQKSVVRDAMKAARGAFNAVVQIPVIGPVLAPIAAAGAFAAVEAFSAEGGYDIPSGVNPLVQAHQNEMVLPAKHANVIRKLADNDSDGNTGGQTRGGNHTHNHYHIHAIDSQDVKRFFRDNNHHLADGVKMAHREGRLPRNTFR